MSHGWTTTDERQLREMAEDGVSTAEIAEALGRSRAAIYSRAQVLDVKLAYPGGEGRKGTVLPDRYVEAILVLRDYGIPVKDISAIFSRKHRMSCDYVRRICNSGRGRKTKDRIDARKSERAEK